MSSKTKSRPEVTALSQEFFSVLRGLRGFAVKIPVR
jgi:hypothetical protein